MAGTVRTEFTLNWTSADSRSRRFKYLTFPSKANVDIKISLVRHGLDTGEIRISAQRPVKGLVLTLDPEAQLDDNFLDLAPGDEQVVKVKGLAKGTKVSWRRELHGCRLDEAGLTLAFSQTSAIEASLCIETLVT